MGDRHKSNPTVHILQHICQNVNIQIARYFHVIFVKKHENEKVPRAYYHILYALTEQTFAGKTKRIIFSKKHLTKQRRRGKIVG